MENDPNIEALDASFELVARQDATDAALGALRGEVDEVKSRLERVARAPRPAIGGGSLGDDRELKGFVDGYLRQGRENELKSMSVGSLADGGYDVPQQIDARIAERLRALSPIRTISQVVQTGSSGYRKLVSLGKAAGIAFTVDLAAKVLGFGGAFTTGTVTADSVKAPSGSVARTVTRYSPWFAGVNAKLAPVPLATVAPASVTVHAVTTPASLIRSTAPA